MNEFFFFCHKSKKILSVNLTQSYFYGRILSNFFEGCDIVYIDDKCLKRLNSISKIIMSESKNADLIKNNFLEEYIKKSTKLDKLLKEIFKDYENRKILKASDIEYFDTIKIDDVARKIIDKYIEISEYTILDEDIELESIDNIIKEINKNKKVSNCVILYLQEIGKIPLLTPKEEIELFTLYKNNEDAKAYKKLCESNLRLVVSIAKKYISNKAAFEDLIQEGNLGLMKAIEKFDLRKGCKLSTYATYWIKQYILRYIKNKSRNVRLPVHFEETINKVVRLKNSYMRDNDGEIPTIEELSAMSGFSTDMIEKCLNHEKDTISLYDSINKNTYDGNSVLLDMIENDNISTEEQCEKEILKDIINEILLSLDNEMEREIIRLRFGLDGKGNKTLEEIGKICDITREKVRMIEAKVLRKLRRPGISSKLKDFY